MKVTVLGRPGCHLCEQAVAELRQHLAGRAGKAPRIEVEEVDIETDDELFRRYLERIPVIRIGDEIACELFFEADAFDGVLERRSRGSG